MPAATAPSSTTAQTAPSVASNGNTAGAVGSDAAAQMAAATGVDALLCVTPYYNKATQNGLIKLFTQIADVSTVPVILYNVPGRTGCNILPETAVKMAKETGCYN